MAAASAPADRLGDDVERMPLVFPSFGRPEAPPEVTATPAAVTPTPPPPTRPPQ
jgi:hypothetical protein